MSGSNDGNSWTEIDRVVDCDCENSGEGTRLVGAPDVFRFVCLRMTELIVVHGLYNISRSIKR